MDEPVLGPGRRTPRRCRHARRCRSTSRNTTWGAPAPSSWPRLPFAHRERVDERRRTGRGDEGCLQHHRAVEVAARRVGCSRRANGPVPGVVAEQPTEERRRCRSGGSTTSRASRPGSPAPPNDGRRASRSRRSVSGSRAATHSWSTGRSGGRRRCIRARAVPKADHTRHPVARPSAVPCSTTGKLFHVTNATRPTTIVSELVNDAA